MKKVQELGKLSDRDAFKKRHMGQGMIIVTPEPENVLAQAESQNLNAQRIGAIVKTSGIRIKRTDSTGCKSWLEF